MSGTGPVRPARVASRRFTSATMTAGVLAGALCFAVAIAAELGGGSTSGGASMTDLTALLEGLRAVAPWAWASAGTYVLIVTPAVALIVSAVEYVRVGDRATAGLAVLVLVVLVASALVAVAR